MKNGESNRGRCPECDLPFWLTKDGRLRVHARKERGGRRHCLGSRQLPASANREVRELLAKLGDIPAVRGADGRPCVALDDLNAFIKEAGGGQ